MRKTMPFETSLISPAVDRYRRERDRYVKLADRVAEICRNEICDQNAIRAQVTFRVKSLKSFDGKLRRFSTQATRNYSTVDEIFSSIGDLAGVRIAAYQLEDCSRLVEHLKQSFRGPGGAIEIDEKDKNRADPKNFYRAIHAQVCLPDDELIGTYDNVADISCEIQICTMIAHVWNEIEHDIGYKPELGAPSSEEEGLIEMLGTTVRLGDQQISMLLNAHARRVSDNIEPAGLDPRSRPFRDVHDFVSRMRDSLDGSMPSFSTNSGQLFDLLVDLGLNTPAELQAQLAQADPSELQQHCDQLSAYIDLQDASTLSPDKTSSDLMLLGLFKNHLPAIIDLHRDRVGRGRGRPTRLYRLARQYKGWQASLS